MKELKDFIERESNRVFAIIARYPDANNDIVDNPVMDEILTMDGFEYFERVEVKPGMVENN
ncbi:MAG: hypothetical protein NXH90_01485 [Flavobacteriaceae bacterium]|nr:hypothetical protein [Flavobacteriaceae bacterium]